MALLMANRPTGPQPQIHRVAGFDLRVFGRHPAGREDVREEQHPLVLDAVGHDDRADVGIGHACVFGLSTRVAAGHVRIAEQAGHRIAVGDLRHVGLVRRIGVVAGGVLFLAAEETAAAGDDERHHHLLPDLQAGVAAPDLDHLAHELVAQDVAVGHAGDHAVVEVQVRAADGGGGDLDDGVPRIDDLGVGDGVHLNVVLSVPGQGAHGALFLGSDVTVGAGRGIGRP